MQAGRPPHLLLSCESSCVPRLLLKRLLKSSATLRTHAPHRAAAADQQDASAGARPGGRRVARGGGAARGAGAGAAQHTGGCVQGRLARNICGARLLPAPARTALRPKLPGPTAVRAELRRRARHCGVGRLHPAGGAAVQAGPHLRRRPDRGKPSGQEGVSAGGRVLLLWRRLGSGWQGRAAPYQRGEPRRRTLRSACGVPAFFPGPFVSLHAYACPLLCTRPYTSFQTGCLRSCLPARARAAPHPHPSAPCAPQVVGFGSGWHAALAMAQVSSRLHAVRLAQCTEVEVELVARRGKVGAAAAPRSALLGRGMPRAQCWHTEAKRWWLWWRRQ